MESTLRAGSVAPLSFLRTESSLGIGNFADLKTYILLAVQRGETLVQLLPINDSGSHYLWPYSAISSFAVNPVYLSIPDIMEQYQAQLSTQAQQQISELIQVAKQEESNAFINYKNVREKIFKILHLVFREIYAHVQTECNSFKNQYPWVWDFALFSVISDQNHGAAWYEWSDKDLREYQEETLQKFYDQNRFDVDFYIFYQKIALQQLQNIREFANQNHVFIKGDIPILVARNSADVWGKRELFLLDYAAGAPPDMFTSGGQEWGSPPLNLDHPDAIAYFLTRFQFAQTYMDMVRIDHVLGIFRLMIWNINKGNIATQGFFYPQRDSHQSTAISREEWYQIGINPDHYLTKTGMITDVSHLGNLSEKCVEWGLAKWIRNRNQIAWINQKETPHNTINVEDWHLYQDNLTDNEDRLRQFFQKNGLTSDEIIMILQERRRLQNMLISYMDDPNQFCMSVYGRETWHYLNLNEEQKNQLHRLLKEKESLQYSFWEIHGKNILKKLQNETTLFLCAEDLGLIDPYVSRVLAELGIPGINIIRWSSSFQKEEQRRLAILTLSTHDTSTFNQWWQEPSTDRETQKRFLNQYLGQETEYIPQNLSKEQLQTIFLKLYEASSLVVIQPFWEILSVFYSESEKRINTPGFGETENWCNRMEQKLEMYIEEKNISDRFRKAIASTGRL